MARTPKTLQLEPADLRSARGETLASKIAGVLVGEIRRGRLRGGERLPGTRALAAMLEVDRQTVQRAVGELVAEGWLAAAPRSGTFVAATLPERARTRSEPLRSAIAKRAAFAWSAPREDLLSQVPQGVVYLGGGVPDVRLAPRAALARAYRRALRTSPRRLLDYGDARGEPSLRVALASMLASERALAVSPDDLLITQGSQHGIDLVARTILRPGDRVAVEDPGYLPIWRTLQLAGAELVPIAVDARGLDVDALERESSNKPIRALYVTPHHQYPTLAVLAPERRAALLDLAFQRRFAIVEDDYDHELHFEGRPVLPLASADRHGSVVYVGSLSKLLAPGLRVGFVVAPRDLAADLVRTRSVSDRQGDHLKEAAIASLLEDGEVGRHERRVKRIYLARREALLAGLGEALGGRVHTERPVCGLALWAELDLDAEKLRRASLARGVLFFTGRDFSWEGKRSSFARFGFGSLDETEMRAALRRVREAYRSIS